MSYRKEMQELVNELREMSNDSKTDEDREKRRRQAEMLDFLINHPKHALANLLAPDAE